MANIFFDFDGTIINSQHRLYNLFVELCPECKMSYDEYWEIKRQRITQKDFLKKYFGYSEEQCEEFHKKWLGEIEKPERLKQDFLAGGVTNVLERLSKNHTLYLVTNRQSKELTFKEVEDLKIKKYFCDILVTEQKKNKAELIREYVKFSPDDILVGDTGEDIKTAKELGIRSVAVTCGILSETMLREYNPDIIIGTINEFR